MTASAYSLGRSDHRLADTGVPARSGKEPVFKLRMLLTFLKADVKIIEKDISQKSHVAQKKPNIFSVWSFREGVGLP